MDDAQKARAQQALLDAIAAAGSESALARILDVTQGAVNQRRRNKDRPYLTAEQAVVVERRLGIPRATSRPDLFEGVVLAEPDDRLFPIYAGDALSLEPWGTMQAETINFARVIAWSPRPPHIPAARGLYGVRIATTTMAPRFEPGSLIVAERHAPPATGDDVLVRNEIAARNNEHIIAHLQAQDAESFTLHQHASGATERIRRNLLAGIHRILTVHDLSEPMAPSAESA